MSPVDVVGSAQYASDPLHHLARLRAVGRPQTAKQHFPNWQADYALPTGLDVNSSERRFIT